MNETNNSCDHHQRVFYSNNCEHNCVNNIGFYTYSCISGFILLSDMSYCVSGVSQLTAPMFFALLSLYSCKPHFHGLSYRTTLHSSLTIFDSNFSFILFHFSCTISFSFIVLFYILKIKYIPNNVWKSS